MANSSDPSYTSRLVALYQLISAPLAATVEADFKAAEKFVAFIRKYGFQADAATSAGKGDLDFGSLRMVSFETRDPVTGVFSRVSIPLLTMVPLPLLQVNDAEFDYNLHIVIVDEKEQTAPSLLGDDAKTTERISFEAVLSDIQEKGVNQSAPFLNANMKIHMTMRQADMPGGIASLLEIAGGNVSSCSGNGSGGNDI